MFDSNNTTSISLDQPLNKFTVAIVPAPALDFPRKAIVVNASRLFSDKGVNWFGNKRIRTGQIVTLISKVGLTYYRFEVDGIEGNVSAKAVEVCSE